MHVPGFDTCVNCHNEHTLAVRVDQCATCHGDFEDVRDIRMMAADYDGDGTDEGVAGEIATMHDALLVAIQSYAANTIGTPIVYKASAYPYWFTDANAEVWRTKAILKVARPTEIAAWRHYQYVAKDPARRCTTVSTPLRCSTIA
jgi:hypothetical protein